MVLSQCVNNSILSLFFSEWSDTNGNQPDGGTAENCLILDSGIQLRDVPCDLTLAPFNAAACETSMITTTSAPGNNPLLTNILFLLKQPVKKLQPFKA